MVTRIVVAVLICSASAAAQTTRNADDYWMAQAMTRGGKGEPVKISVNSDGHLIAVSSKQSLPCIAELNEGELHKIEAAIESRPLTNGVNHPRPASARTNPKRRCLSHARPPTVVSSTITRPG